MTAEPEEKGEPEENWSQRRKGRSIRQVLGKGTEDTVSPWKWAALTKGSHISHVSISSTKSLELLTCLTGFFTSIIKICLGLMQGLFKKDGLQNILFESLLPWLMFIAEFPDSILRTTKLHRSSVTGAEQWFQLHGAWYTGYSGKWIYTFEWTKKKNQGT